MLVVLVRSDDLADVAVAIRLQMSAAGPESTGLEKDLGTGVAQKPFVTSGLPILPDRIGDVRANVLFLPTAKDIDDLTIWTDNPLRRGLRTGMRTPRRRGHRASPSEPILPARHPGCGSDT